VNGAEGISDIEGEAATGSGERAGKRASFNGAEGISDIEDEAATGSGQRASFKSVVLKIVNQKVLTLLGPFFKTPLPIHRPPSFYEKTN
jgi:hypothetical protein